MPDKLLNDHFLSLADARNPDLRQDQLVALLDASPQTEAEARAVLSRLHHRQEWTRRKQRERFISLTFDPIAKQTPDDDGAMMAALARLSPEDQQLVREHVIGEVSLRDIGKRIGLSKDTVRKRFNLAKQKLAALAQKQ